MTGRPLLALSSEDRTVALDLPGHRLSMRLEGGPESIFFGPHEVPAESTGEPIPDVFPTSDRVRAEYAERATHDHAAQLRQNRLRPLLRRAAKLKRLRANLESDRTKLAKMAARVAQGELLKSQLHLVPRGASSVEVTDWACGASVRIPLEPALDAKANLARIFAKSKKGRRGLPLVEGRLADVTRSVEALESEIASVRSASEAALMAWTPEPPRAAPQVGGHRSSKAKVSLVDQVARRFVSSDGLELLVGKGAKENDRLTLAVARGHDLWLHARGRRGAHVVLRLSKDQAPTQEALLDAAHLAAHYSEARGDDKVDVLYTNARHVKKIKGAPVGQVSVAKERTFHLRFDQSRLTRLFENRK